LLEQVAASRVTRAVVAWAPLEDPSIGTYLAELLERARVADVRVAGVRRSFESVPDGFITDEAVARGARTAAERGLVIDLVLFGGRLDEAIELVGRVPEASFVLDHLAKPGMDGPSLAAWRGSIGRLARLPNIVAKVSGLSTMASGADWEPELEPLVAHAAATFGWRRLLYASDWPICDLAGGYGRWLAFLRRAAAEATPDEQAAFFAHTAEWWYGLTQE
jgi:L-fuconolactonase